jgi:glutaredoxin
VGAIPQVVRVQQRRSRRAHPDHPLLVQGAHIPSVLAAAITLAAAFVVRFVYHALWVYAPKQGDRAGGRPRPSRAGRAYPGIMTSENTPITMFGADWCRDCVRTKKQLDELGVEYTYVDLVADPAAADVAREISGRTNIPVVVYPDASHHVEPTNADVEAKLRELS